MKKTIISFVSCFVMLSLSSFLFASARGRAIERNGPESQEWAKGFTTSPLPRYHRFENIPYQEVRKLLNSLKDSDLIDLDLYHQAEDQLHSPMLEALRARRYSAYKWLGAAMCVGGLAFCGCLIQSCMGTHTLLDGPFVAFLAVMATLPGMAVMELFERYGFLRYTVFLKQVSLEGPLEVKVETSWTSSWFQYLDHGVEVEE